MQFDKGRALVVGLARYSEVSGLPNAVLNDARDVADLLRSGEYCGFPAANVRLLLDEQATLRALRGALAELAIASDEDDTVIVFFSGHGARLGQAPEETSALVPFDTRFSDLEGSTLSESELSLSLAKIKAKRLLVLIDACHAGGAGVLKGAAGNGRFGLVEKTLQRLATGTGRVIMASSRASETSLVMAGARNSVFTERLLEALRGHARTNGDGLIRVFDIFNYVAEHVAQTVPGQQHPIFKASDLEDNFPVALQRGGTKSAGLETGSEDGWRELEQLLADLYPAGPTDQEIWSRAGGDLSRLKLGGTGRANWFTALRTLKLGGGGSGMSRQALISASLDDFPQHPELIRLQRPG